MSDFELVKSSRPVTDASYRVACWACATKFDAGSSRWCGCDAAMRTLECPHCGSCFCKAPVLFKQSFWNDAPGKLRRDARRFRIHLLNAGASGLEPNPAKTESTADQPHVLIVDDDEPIRSLAACYVEQIGYKATAVSGPEEALAMTRAVSFQVVLTDALMPRMDGRELCRKLKEMHGDQMKVVLMTSLYKSGRFRTEARHVFNVDEFLVKPFQFGELRDALQRVAPLAGRPADRNAALVG